MERHAERVPTGAKMLPNSAVWKRATVGEMKWAGRSVKAKPSEQVPLMPIPIRANKGQGIVKFTCVVYVETVIADTIDWLRPRFFTQSAARE